MSDFAINALILSIGFSIPIAFALLGRWASHSLEKERQALANNKAKPC